MGSQNESLGLRVVSGNEVTENTLQPRTPFQSCLWPLKLMRSEEAASFPGFFLTRPTEVGRVGENPGNEVAQEV